MKNALFIDEEYHKFIQEIKQRIKSSQIKAALSVNQELLHLYWEIAQRVVEKQKQTLWGDGFIEKMSKDLKAEFPTLKGFSKRNIELMRQWYIFWKDTDSIAKQLATQIPWWHNIIIITKIKNHQIALYYIQKTIENNWSRATLIHQIESNLYSREGKAVTNFSVTLPLPHSDLAQQITKDPYIFDFLSLQEKYDETELEEALITHITRFLLELGSGFSYIGKQYKLEVGGDEFFIDLLFYHVKLHCYVVVELKTVKFQPEHSGKLNFYTSVVDDVLKSAEDKPTIGILICKSKNNTVVEYALKDINKPIGVTEYNLTKSLPEEFKSSLPTIEEFEAELSTLSDKE